jgi:hypothetical protein
MEGVREAQSASTHHCGKLSKVAQTDTGHLAHLVDFDVALMLEQGSGTKGGMGL